MSVKFDTICLGQWFIPDRFGLKTIKLKCITKSSGINGACDHEENAVKIN